MEGQAAGGLSCIMSTLKWSRRSSADVRIIIAKIGSHTIFLDLLCHSPHHVAFWVPSETPLTKNNTSLLTI